MDTNQTVNEINGAILMESVDETPSDAKETVEILHEMATILRTDLDMETLAICFRLIESGVNAEALAKVILSLRAESAHALQFINK